MNIPINYPEKIILVIDSVVEPNSTGFKTNSGERYNSLYMLKRVSEIFMHNKSSFNPKNEFAIMTLDSLNVNWLCDFTKVVDSLIPSLEAIKETNGKHEKYFDIQPVFETVHKHVSENKQLLENYVVRIILLYCRSNIIPRFNMVDNSVQQLIKNSNFFFDVLYIHESDCEKYKCKEIFNEIRNLDIRNSSYVMEVSRDAMELHNLMAKLLAHPKQRVPCEQFNSAISPIILRLAEEEQKKRDAAVD